MVKTMFPVNSRASCYIVIWILTQIQILLRAGHTGKHMFVCSGSIFEKTSHVLQLQS